MIQRILVAVLFLASGSPCASAADDEPTFRNEPLEKLLEDLMDKDARIRRMAASTLGMPDGTQGKGGPRPRGDLWPAILALVEALKDTDAVVRANSVKSIGLLMRYRGIPEKVDTRAETVALAVIASLTDSDDLVKSTTGIAMLTVPVDTKSSVKALAAVLKHEEPKVREAAAVGSRGVKPIADIVPALAARLKDPVAAVRLTSATSLCAVRGTSLKSEK